MNNIKPGKVYGLLSFVNMIIMLYFTLLISIFFPDINIDKIIIVDKISFGLFSITWSAVFGSGAIKKLKGSNNE